MKQKRDKVFIWCTWLTKLISGENQCEYASWYKAHYKCDKQPGDFNLCKWNIKHNQLVHKHRGMLEKKDYVVTTESQNSFKLDLLEGITISGKADLIALKWHAPSLVEDCKTGSPKNSDLVQVMLYMLFLPLSIDRFKDIIFTGDVIYEDSEVRILPEDVDENLKKVVWDLIKRIGDEKPCRKVPSYDECKWCDISKEDCPERIE